MATPDEAGFTLGPTILQLIVTMTWATLLKPGKNRLFNLYLVSEAVLDQFFNFASAASLSFAPGLLEALLCVSPPTINWFKNLPTNSVSRWAVYALVLEKPGCKTLIYIGSGTSTANGVAARWRQYDEWLLNWEWMPSRVGPALKNDYKITHKGTLVWIPFPPPAWVPVFRLLFKAMEAMLTYAFWAVESRDTSHTMRSLCSWPLDSFTYDGLGTHSPMSEQVPGNFDLTDEQLEELAQRTLKTNNETKERSRLRIKASERISCKMCHVNCSSYFELARHNGSNRHLERVRKTAAGTIAKYRCKVCPWTSDKASAFVNHRNRKHGGAGK
ncbi:unnamed protein product [Zymoseptoria tritici ST99CH_3D7]|uniref:C2H2-type domain-containing protein n=1 Tax=Zymoseptoria tritici (strain ST99CH_3D7) TaxID=1276538 RepID=A0A1X7RUI9_ZYMT9|nr:unnamed protein product [Zymoseptoria tritici ST99CH_3D7]